MNFYRARKSVVFYLSLVALFKIEAHSEASGIAEQWSQATVRIENEWGHTGTGFLVFKKVDNDRGAVFLVTNKHVVHEDAKLRETAQRLTLFVNIEQNDGTIVGRPYEIPLVQQERKIWREHKDAHVDVLAVNVSNSIASKREIKNRWANLQIDFVTPQILKEEDISVGEDILIIGYPDGLAHAKTNHPLVRQGIIATRIGENITIDVQDAGSRKLVEIPGFLVDAAVVPGSSGSPVLWKPAATRTVRGKTTTTVGGEKTYLLGIVSAARTMLIPFGKNKEGKSVAFPALAGLGIVYSAETVKDTIDLFLK
jgi:hypothetical protein